MGSTGRTRYIEFITHHFIRGMSFDDAIIIVDEMQNMTFEEIDTVMTVLVIVQRLCGVVITAKQT
jgi:predicted ribonuclease YlaK